MLLQVEYAIFKSWFMRKMMAKSCCYIFLDFAKAEGGNPRQPKLFDTWHSLIDSSCILGEVFPSFFYRFQSCKLRLPCEIKNIKLFRRWDQEKQGFWKSWCPNNASTRQFFGIVFRFLIRSQLQVKVNIALISPNLLKKWRKVKYMKNWLTKVR